MADEKSTTKAAPRKSNRQGTGPDGLESKPHFPVGDGEDVFDVEEASEKGWVGSRPMRHPDEAYTLQSGPEAPHSAEEGPE